MIADEPNELERARKHREDRELAGTSPTPYGTATLIDADECVCELDLAEPAPCFAKTHKTPDGKPRY
jgi:hypothetical protein